VRRLSKHWNTCGTGDLQDLAMLESAETYTSIALISAIRQDALLGSYGRRIRHASLHRSDAAHEQRDPASKQTV